MVLNGITLNLIAGRALGAESPVKVYSPLCYLAAHLEPGQSFTWPRQYPEQAIYVAEGNLAIDGEKVDVHEMAVLPDAEEVSVSSSKGARIAILAGEPIGPRFLWWNFVSSSAEKIREKAAEWEAGGFDRVPGDEEFIPLPQNRPMPRG